MHRAVTRRESACVARGGEGLNQTGPRLTAGVDALGCDAQLQGGVRVGVPDGVDLGDKLAGGGDSLLLLGIALLDEGDSGAEPVTLLTEQWLDALSGQDEVDLLAEYAFPLAVSVVCRLIGIPESDQPLLCSWVRALACADLADAAAFETASDGLAEYFVPFILAKRDRPGDDPVSILATARDDDRLADHELISMVYQLFFAGHQSSAHFTANAALLLLTHPDQRAKLAANPDLLPSAIEEMLRFESPAKVPSWRFATHPVPIGDVVIAPGEPVLALLASGGRDEARHRAPEQFLIDRADTDHLAFGYGIHHCIGAALARMESRIAISRLFARFPEIQLARPVAALRWRVNLMTRGVSELPVRLNAASEGDPPWTPTKV